MNLLKTFNELSSEIYPLKLRYYKLLNMKKKSKEEKAEMKNLVKKLKPLEEKYINTEAQLFPEVEI